MNWKLIVKTILVVGIVTIPLQIAEILFEVSLFYHPDISWQLIAFILTYAIAVILTFAFVFKRTNKFRFFQSLLTVVLGLSLSYGFTILGIVVYLKFFS